MVKCHLNRTLLLIVRRRRRRRSLPFAFVKLENLAAIHAILQRVNKHTVQHVLARRLTKHHVVFW